MIKKLELVKDVEPDLELEKAQKDAAAYDRWLRDEMYNSLTDEEDSDFSTEEEE